MNKKLFTFLSFAALALVTSNAFSQQYGAPPNGLPQFQGTLTNAPVPAQNAAASFPSHPEAVFWNLTFTGTIVNWSGTAGYQANYTPWGESMFMASYTSSVTPWPVTAWFSANGTLLTWRIGPL